MARTSERKLQAQFERNRSLRDVSLQLRILSYFSDEFVPSRQCLADVMRNYANLPEHGPGLPSVVASQIASHLEGVRKRGRPRKACTLKQFQRMWCAVQDLRDEVKGLKDAGAKRQRASALEKIAREYSIEPRSLERWEENLPSALEMASG